MRALYHVALDTLARSRPAPTNERTNQPTNEGKNERVGKSNGPTVRLPFLRLSSDRVENPNEYESKSDIGKTGGFDLSGMARNRARSGQIGDRVVDDSFGFRVTVSSPCPST